MTVQDSGRALAGGPTAAPTAGGPESAAGLRRNLPLLRLYAAFTYPFACVPFLFFFYREHGLDSRDYTDLMAVYYLTMTVAEVPTGLLADLLGRKLAMVLGPVVLAAGFLTTWGWRTMAGFAAGEVLMGLGHAVLSGPPSALLYETLQQAGQEQEFLRQESRNQTARLFGTSGAFLAGGFLAHQGGIAPTIVLTALLGLVASGCALFLHESGSAARSHLRARSVLSSSRAMIRRPGVRWMVAYYAVLFFLLRFGFHTYAPYFDASRLTDYRQIGLFFFLLNVVAAACAFVGKPLRTRFSERALLLAQPVLVIVSLLAMSVHVAPAMVWLFFVQQIPFGLHWGLVQTYVNHRIDSHSRATVLSILSFSGRLLTTLLFPLTGELLLHSGVQTCYAVTGLVALAAMVPLFVAGPPRG